jgi:hypothetical protein
MLPQLGTVSIFIHINLTIFSYLLKYTSKTRHVNMAAAWLSPGISDIF